MDIEVCVTPFGAVALKKGEIIDKVLYGRDPKKAAVKLQLQEGLEEIRARTRGDIVHMDYFEIGEKLGFDRKEAQEFVRAVALELAKAEMRTQVTRDYLIIQTINTLDDMNEALNGLSIRLREWFGLFYPELSRAHSEHKEYVAQVLKEVDKPTDSMGIEFTKHDKDSVRALAQALKEMYDENAKLEKYIEELMKEIAPNILSIIGPLLGAKLIARASGLRNLAGKPSSTVQLLGAEKALFKHLRTGVPSPKHGLIFQHPLISNAPLKKRGKIARALAGKLSIAARVDYYGHKQNLKIKESLDKRLSEIK